MLTEQCINQLRHLARYYDEEIISRAFLKLYEIFEAHPEKNSEEFAKNVWYLLLKRTSVDLYRQTKREIPGGSVDRRTQSCEAEVEQADWVRKTIAVIYQRLNEDDLTTLRLFAYKGAAVTAELLGMQRTNIYHVLKKIRQKVA